MEEQVEKEDVERVVRFDRVANEPLDCDRIKELLDVPEGGNRETALQVLHLVEQTAQERCTERAGALHGIVPEFDVTLLPDVRLRGTYRGPDHVEHGAQADRTVAATRFGNERHQVDHRLEWWSHRNLALVEQSGKFIDELWRHRPKLQRRGEVKSKAARRSKRANGSPNLSGLDAACRSAGLARRRSQGDELLSQRDSPVRVCEVPLPRPEGLLGAEDLVGLCEDCARLHQVLGDVRVLGRIRRLEVLVAERGGTGDRLLRSSRDGFAGLRQGRRDVRLGPDSSVDEEASDNILRQSADAAETRAPKLQVEPL